MEEKVLSVKKNGFKAMFLTILMLAAFVALFIVGVCMTEGSVPALGWVLVVVG